MSSALYEGEVVHARADRWARRTFRHAVYVACLDLDELPSLRLRLLGRGRPFSIRGRDYLDGRPDLAAAARATLAARGLPRPDRVELITQLRTLGYLFNPVSWFLGYDRRGALETVIAEVSNTYGGRHAYVLGPRDLVDGAFEHPKTFFVSPFLHGAARYRHQFREVGPRLDARIDVVRPDGDVVLHTRVSGARVPLDDRALARVLVRYPAMTLQVIGLIHWEAMKNHWRRMPYRRPGPDHAAR